ncbi:MAG: DUF192 domain-containing protein [Nanoarchaeota archaeon]
MKRHNNAEKISSILLAIVIIAVFITLIMSYPFKKSSKVCFENNTCFKAEISDTEEERQSGLMFRDFLKENKAMLFIFQTEAIYPFWMKNTFIPIDIIWISEENKVVHIEKNALPCKKENCDSINPEVKALYVLEINAGLAEKYGILEQDNVTISSHNN